MCQYVSCRSLTGLLMPTSGMVESLMSSSQQPLVLRSLPQAHWHTNQPHPPRSILLYLQQDWAVPSLVQRCSCQGNMMGCAYICHVYWDHCGTTALLMKYLIAPINLGWVIKATYIQKKRKTCKRKREGRGHPDLNRGPLDLQSNALPLSYTPNFLLSALFTSAFIVTTLCKHITICIFQYISCYAAEHLAILGEQLLELKEFLDKHIHLFNISQQDPGYDFNIATCTYSTGAYIVILLLWYTIYCYIIVMVYHILLYCCYGYRFKGSPSNVHQKMLKFMRPSDMQSDSPAHVHQAMLDKYKGISWQFLPIIW